MNGTRLGRADLHVHTLASDGVSSVAEVLAAAELAGLDLIAIADHERIDAALAARALAEERGSRVGVIVGEEISTRGGHLLALFMKERIPPWRSLRDSIARVHDQGALAIIAHPLLPYPLCASARSIRRLLDESDERFRPDAIEAFNSTTAASRWGRRVPAFTVEVGLPATAGSDAHRAHDVGKAVTTFAGRSTDDLRAAILAGTTDWQGEAYPLMHQLTTFRHQLAKNAAAVRDTARHRLLRRGSGRDLGYERGTR
jgi:predicted metal-dependent phosphoesterase TrpH